MTAKQRVLRVLMVPGWHTAIELCQPWLGGIAFNQRIIDLRRAGIEVESRKVARKPYYEYHLLTPLSLVDWDGCQRIPAAVEPQPELL